jgi:hypothetical protein
MQEAQGKATEKMLQQARHQVTIFNEGILDVREAINEAEIRDVKQRARLETEKLQAAAQVDALRVQQEQASMMVKTMSNIMCALFDPDMDDNQREKLLTIMNGMSSAQKALPQIIVTPDPTNGGTNP